MSTSKIVLKTTDEYNAGYTPRYRPLMGELLRVGREYAVEAGKHTFRKIEASGDLRSRRVTPKDTEMKLISLGEGRKEFKKYYNGSQIQISFLQDQQGIDDGIAQVLDEHWVAMDEELLFGGAVQADGTGQQNSGLFYSSDVNYITESSKEIAATSTTLPELYAAIKATARDSDAIAGQKILFVYGSTLMTAYDGMFSETSRPFRSVLQEAMPGTAIVEVPSVVTPSGKNGWILANTSQLRLHYTQLPALYDRGEERKDMFWWFNFLMGSTMLEVNARGGVIHQPVTFA